ncbi:RNA-binding S4 domain-containing protein [Brevirhabdus sp.]|uniref:RNA-binding S4 domain-containing protein n=1 Tax=Brevirhabdus sp. TaxID=2004514 RepID=UPI004059EACF
MATQTPPAAPGPRPTQRVDKWLWHARFFKTRGLAAKLVTGGHLRVNGARAGKPARAVGPGDTLTFPQARRVRVVRIEGLAERRGPAAEAQALYHDLSPPEPDPSPAEHVGGGHAGGGRAGTAVSHGPVRAGKGRPTKRDRRKLDLSRPDPLE